MVKVGVSFYYIGDIHRATDLYKRLFGSEPSYAEEDWVRFHLEGGDIAFHLDPDMELPTVIEPVKFGAVVSLTVEDIHARSLTWPKIWVLSPSAIYKICPTAFKPNCMILGETAYRSSSRRMAKCVPGIYVATQHSVHWTAGTVRHFWTGSQPRR